MIQSDLDISTKVRHNGQTGVLVYNRCRQGNQVVAVEFDNDLFPIQLVNVNELEVKHGGEKWMKVSDLGRKK
jgi:hypothetical protein